MASGDCCTTFQFFLAPGDEKQVCDRCFLCVADVFIFKNSAWFMLFPPPASSVCDNKAGVT